MSDILQGDNPTDIKVLPDKAKEGVFYTSAYLSDGSIIIQKNDRNDFITEGEVPVWGFKQNADGSFTGSTVTRDKSIAELQSFLQVLGMNGQANT